MAKVTCANNEQSSQYRRQKEVKRQQAATTPKYLLPQTDFAKCALNKMLTRILGRISSPHVT